MPFDTSLFSNLQHNANNHYEIRPLKMFINFNVFVTAGLLRYHKKVSEYRSEFSQLSAQSEIDLSLVFCSYLYPIIGILKRT
jgi:hypothetical protein